MGETSDVGRDIVLRLQVLGDVGLWLGDRPTFTSASTTTEPALGPGKALALVIYLSAAPRRRSSREHLLAMLWSDRAPDEARHILRQTLWSVRRRFGAESIRVDGDELTLGSHITSDRDEFLSALEEGRLNDALTCYRGDFLPQFASPGASEFERWAELERQRLRAAFLRASEARVRQLLSIGQPRQAVAIARRAREADPHDEGTWRILIGALLAAGDVLGAATEADLVEQYASREDVTLDAATRAVVRQARTADSTNGDEQGDSERVSPDLVGREREFAIALGAWERVRATLEPVRIEVVSESGFGKSRFLRDVELRLRSIRSRVVSLRAHAGQRGVSFAFAADMASALAALPGAAGISPGAAASLVALNPSLSASYPHAPVEGAAADEAARRRTFALHELVSAVAEDTPIALLIDDAHWIDPLSRSVVFGALQRLTSERVLVMAATRPSDGPLFDAPTAALRMHALGPAEIEALVSSMGELPDEEWTTQFIAVLHKSTAGIPLLIIDVMQRLLDRGLLERDHRRWIVPSHEALVLALEAPGAGASGRLETLGADARDVLVLLAVAGEPLRLTLLAAANGSPAHAIEPLLESLERLGLVRRATAGCELTHDTLAEATLGVAGEEPVRRAHLALGRALAAEGNAPYFALMRAAQHLASGAADDELAMLLERVIRMARATGDRRETRDFVSDAIGGSVGDDRRRRVERATRWRLHRGRRRVMGIIAASIVALVGWGMLRPATAAPRTPEASFVAVYDGALDPLGKRVFLTRDMFLPVTGERREGAGVPLDLRMTGAVEDYMLTSPFFEDGGMSEQPNGRIWASRGFSRFMSRITTITPTKEDSRAFHTLVRHAGAVGTPTWAPDGSMIAFTRERFDRNASEIAIVEVATKRVHPLRMPSLSTGSERTVIWSPDGSRLAFVHATIDSVAGEVCWTSVDGAIVKCGMVPGDAVAVHAWEDEQHAIVEVDRGGRHDLVRLDMDRGTDVVVEAKIPRVLVSPDGRWVLRRCERPRCQFGWDVGPMGSPALARPLIVSPLRGAALRRWRADSALAVKEGVQGPWNLPSALVPHWGTVTPPRRHIASLEVSMDVGGPQLRFTARVRDQHGRDLTTAPLMRMYTLDSAEAVLSDSGVVTWKYPNAAGRFVVSIGGWRADTAFLLALPTNGAPRAPEESRRLMREAFKRWGRSER